MLIKARAYLHNLICKKRIEKDDGLQAYTMTVSPTIYELHF